MCLSRLHQVRSVCGPGKVLVEDMDGRPHEVSLLALEPPDPEPGPGDWLVVHSGYAIDRADAREAETVPRRDSPGQRPSGASERVGNVSEATTTRRTDRAGRDERAAGSRHYRRHQRDLGVRQQLRRASRAVTFGVHHGEELGCLPGSWCRHAGGLGLEAALDGEG